MKRLIPILLIVIVAACQSAPPEKVGQLELPSFAPRHYICYRVSEALNIDGELNEVAWKNAPWTDLFVDIEGDKKPAPALSTRAKMLWDDEYLYIGAYLEEPHLCASLTERDAVIFYDNDFEVFIDPNGDTHGYYEFEMNAFNTVWDLLLVKPYRDGGPPINNWDINGLKSAISLKGTINQPDDIDEGWFIELAFPLNVLREYCGGVDAKAGNQWRINFSRVQWQYDVIDGQYKKKTNPETGKHYHEDNWVWSPQGVIDMHRPETWGFLQFSDVVAGEGEEAFKFNKDELVKWELYTIYHAQRLFKSKTGAYAKSVHELSAVHLPELQYVNKIATTGSLFEAVVSRAESEFNWHINNEGRTWKMKK
ncbi:carbohydrate-binding family 9-like protein [Carboxylicivirga mesophila]|uniref:Carbohydrate-binding family 9-like protein n=1 Tax=Carboxylicivirga mesophila TaxID=1166478 RepID=A0ABS5K8C2_9BACT|nr:carbohydrate-binding family 9-like protein [Carboxylicivirga mesophila]MBS2211219.1 carbohydrate-binding family 9-like protein [Carboxylicivirga mesophila]